MDISSGNLSGIWPVARPGRHWSAAFADAAFVFCLFLLGVCAARLWIMAVLPMSDSTEPRYAEIARLMLLKDDWVTLWFSEEQPFWGKPPLAFWTQALAMKLFGVNDLAARLPSLLATGMTVVLLMQLAQRLGGVQQARVSAIIFCTMALPFAAAGAVMTDAMLTLGTTLSLVSAAFALSGQSRTWRWLFFLGLAIGLLAKGPISVILVGCPLFGWAVWTGRWRELFSALPWWRGSALTLLIAAPWYILAELKTPGFLDYFLYGEHIRRFTDAGWAGDLYGRAHDRPRGTIWLYLALASLPWGPLGLFAYWRKRRAARKPSHPDHIMKFIFLAAVSPALFFTLAGNILWTYVLPGLPFLALAIARVLSDRFQGGYATWIAALLVPVISTVGGIYLAARPHQLPTQYGLLQEYSRQPEAVPGNLYYLDPIPFSARYYGRGTTRSLQAEQLPSLLQVSETVFLAVRQRDVLPTDAAIHTVYADRHYRLLRIGPGRQTAALPSE